MSLSERFLALAHKLLPSPFTIAVLLTFLTFLLAFLFTDPQENHSAFAEGILLGEYWQSGFWGFLQFAMQMMLILVLGHALALTKPAGRVINVMLPFCSNTARAALIVTLMSVIVAYINWGLGLIFGAILARKVGEYASKNQLRINYPIIGASGYAGLMVWHGGLSGSAPLKVAEAGHHLVDKIGVIPAGETLGSDLNFVVVIATLVILPLVMYLVGSRTAPAAFSLPGTTDNENNDEQEVSGAEKLDHSIVLAYLLGGAMILLSLRTVVISQDKLSLSFLNLNFINFFLFGLGLILTGSIYKYLKGVREAVQGAAGILIQFPLYAGIMGIMSESGLITLISNHFISISTQFTFPLFTFISAALVNIFVPSGGGQWIIQGPIVVEAALQLGVPAGKSIMALAYGDQLTNMLQPFWALPLLGITGLKAKEILPYTFILFVFGLIIFSACLMIF